MKTVSPGSNTQDPNHLSRTMNAAWGAERYSHGGQVRADGVLNIESTKSRFLASALDFRNSVWRLGNDPKYSTPTQTLSAVQTDLLLGLSEQNRTMGRIHKTLQHSGLHGVLREIKIGSSSWWVPGQGGPDNYKAWVGEDYKVEVELSVRAMDWLVKEWNTMRDADMAIAMYLQTSAVEMHAQCVWCLLEEDEEAKRAAGAEPK
ncbi:hypothetical protein PG994_006942 [Apiospora phragmitis]|uniref:Uncharacterized protein n=1 Tax=Apiospora phragmitis TaxID=2905665 RepID=A0ABR1VJ62_9PEZI